MPEQIKDEELQPEQTEGFKLGEKKTIDEYKQLDQNDESLRKWKESLGIGSGTSISDPKDPRKVIILSLGLEGSYSPNTTDKPVYEKKFEPETAPSGMMARGHYNAVSKFIDDDGQTHLKFEWSFDIKKDW